MSTIAIAPRQVAASRVAAASTGVASALSDTADVAWRNLLAQLRTPQALVFATIQPADAHPLKRLGTPQDVATAAAFLASGQAAWIAGVILDVVGGAVLV
jgi:NAD(P)-dependent dehydrogenase (short-subunit alcohol dehydrogenase family)